MGKTKCWKEKGGPGFRDLYSFNMAMLARQGWRLIQHPESLCAKVLRARYFPEGDLLNTTIKPGISYSCKSIKHHLKKRVLNMG